MALPSFICGCLLCLSSLPWVELAVQYCKKGKSQHLNLILNSKANLSVLIIEHDVCYVFFLMFCIILNESPFPPTFVSAYMMK